MLASATIATYTMNYLTTFGNHTLGLCAGAWLSAPPWRPDSAAPCSILLGGMLSDRFGRKPVMMAAAFLLLLLVGDPAMFPGDGPAFTRRIRAVTPARPLMAHCCGLLAACGRRRPCRKACRLAVRSGGIGIVYALAISIFGGTRAIRGHLADRRARDSPLAPGLVHDGRGRAGIFWAWLAMPRKTAAGQD